jgi:hypothetical protein
VPDLDRRSFLRAGLALAVAAGAGFPRLAAPAAASAAAAGPALSGPRRASYRTLLTVLREAPDGRFGHRRPDADAQAFADAYAVMPDAGRRHADAVLDAIGELVGRGGTPAQRYAALRDRPGGATPSPEEAHRRAVLMAAVGLVEGPEAVAAERAPIEALS